MSRGELYALCEGIARGDVAMQTDPDAEKVYGTDPYRLLNNADFTPAELLPVYQQAAEHWIPRVTGKEVLLNGKSMTDPKRQVHYNDTNMAESIIDHIGDLARELPEAREYLYDTTVRLLRNEIERGPLGGDAADSSLAFHGCYSLGRVASSALEWNNQRPVGIKDADKLLFVASKLPELAALAEESQTRGNDHTTRIIQEFINKVLKNTSEALPPDTDTEA